MGVRVAGCTGTATADQLTVALIAKVVRMNTCLFLALALMPSQACPGGVCPIPNSPQIVQYSSPMSWVKHNDDTYLLMQNGVQVGVYQPSTNTYWAVNLQTRTYHQQPLPTTEPPVKPKSEVEVCNDWRICGVDRTKIVQKEMYSRETGEVSKQKAFQSIGENVPDDSKKLYVTFIDTDEKRANDAMKDFQTKQPEVAKTVHLKAYQADNPLVRDSGFVTSGSPTVYVQRGQAVVGRGDAYPGADKLAEFVRKKQDSYDPKKDPPLTGTPGPIDLSALLEPIFKLIQANPGVSVLLLIGGLFVFFGRKSN